MRSLQWKLGELALRARHRLAIDIPGSDAKIPFTAICGDAHSPMALVMAGAHGDEFEGPAAILDVMQEIDPERVSGSILLVPVANPEAFHAGTRRHPDGGDLNRLFPGKSDGTACEKLAQLLFQEFAAESSCVLSMHGWSKEAEVLPYVEYFATDNGEGRAAAFALGFQYVEPYDWPEGVLGRALQGRSIAIVETEIGGLGMITREGQEFSKRVIHRFLQHFGFNAGHTPIETQAICMQHTDIAAEGCGLFRCSVALGDRVRIGQELGSIVDLSGALRQRVAATADGVIGIVRRFAAVRHNDLLIRIFSERKSA